MRLLVAIALLFAVIPGMSEVAEAAVHLVIHADLPHHADEAEHDSGCAEHTCTPLAHHCGCHATMAAQPSQRTMTTASIADVTQLDPTAIATVFGRACERPPLRPPIA